MHEGCDYFVWPKDNAEFWRDKLLRNKERDTQKIGQLKTLGWKVITVWECQLKHKNLEITMERLIAIIRGGRNG